ncbi:MAG: hypothetical protein EA424_12060 [Planctomycetaceae bacterium]|nr:MAG: hypothetical protein EA424_12060 [Planctomycetaceae bacterium]
MIRIRHRGYLPGQLQRSDWLRASLDEALPQLGTKLIGPLAANLRENPDASAGLGTGNDSKAGKRVPFGGRAPNARPYSHPYY